MKTKELENILEVEGVNKEGYGLLAQAVMFDIDLPITSKAIYAYLCSHLGSGRTIFPKVTTIIADLKISENTFYKYLKLLIENGYIKKSKAKGFLNKNVYTICNSVSKVKVPAFQSESKNSLLAIDGINASGYGVIPKLIMKDSRLNVKAKALIGFLYSIAQADSCAYPHRTTICTFLNISKDVYYKALNQLINTNYITVVQRHGKNGCFSVNDYILNSNPKIVREADAPCLDFCGDDVNGLNSEISPCPDFCGNGENGLNSEVSPCLDFCGYEKVHRVRDFEVSPCPDFCGNNNSTNNNSKSNNNILSSSNLKVEELRLDDEPDKIREKIQKLSWYDYYLDFKNLNNKKPKEEKQFAKTYCVVVDTLIEMLGHESGMYLKNRVSKKQMIKALNLCIEDDYCEVKGYNPDCDFSLRDLIHQIIWNYEIAKDKYEINNSYLYLRSIIWNNIRTYPLE